MAICDVGSHHDLEGVVRGLLIPHTCGEPSTSAHLHKSWEVGASASGAWDLGGLPAEQAIPTLVVNPALKQNLHKSWEVGASASGAWDLGGLPIMPPWPFGMWGAIMTLVVW